MIKKSLPVKPLIFFIFAISVALISGSSLAATIRVPADHATIQAGIDAALDGDTVLIADGTYKGEGNKNIDFKGKAITLQSQNGAKKCIIDCEDEGRGFYFHSGESNSSILSGFTIFNGAIRDQIPVYGGGIYCNSSSPTIRDCMIFNNKCSSLSCYGGGICCVSSSPSIIDCIISDNNLQCRGNFGGGIYCGELSCPTIKRCIVTNNALHSSASASSGYGGGIYCDSSSSPTIMNCFVSRNTTYAGSARGAGIYCSSSSLKIMNATIANNTAAGLYSCHGGGVFSESSSPSIVNCILWDNDPDQIYGNPDAIYSDVKSGYVGLGNINIDPLFAINSVYQLTINSPCIDSGTATGAPSTDIDGNPRPQGLGYDMGAYEFFLSSSVPTSTTGSAYDITMDSARLSGKLNPNGGSTWAYFEYGTTQDYGAVTLAMTAGSGTAEISVSARIASLVIGSTYHYRLVGANSAGVDYGEDQTFGTSPSAPSVTTGSATSVSTNSAILNGTLNPNGANTTYFFEYGPTTAYGFNTTATEIGSGTIAVSVNGVISGLELGSSYHFRLVARNSVGTNNGDDQTFMTHTLAPTVSTGIATSVTSNSATLNGAINPNGASTTYYFEYGTTTAFGSTSITTSAGSGTTQVTVTANITELSPHTTYNFRLVATNSVGTAVGNDQTFTTPVTPPTPPSVTTGSAAYLSSSSVVVYGKVNPNGSDTEAYFEYGPTTGYGFVTPAEDIGSGSKAVSVSSTVTDLIPEAGYHYRLVASNSAGTSSGADKLLYQDLLYVSPDGTCDGKAPCFSTIKDAIDSAASCALIRICEEAFDEDVVVDHTYGIVLSGGWDSTFAIQESETVIHSLTIGETGGPVETDNVVLQ